MRGGWYLGSRGVVWSGLVVMVGAQLVVTGETSFPLTRGTCCNFEASLSPTVARKCDTALPALCDQEPNC